MASWLCKSEPGNYSIDDLERDGSTCWDGVRNYEARNNMDAMALGDEAIFYHSSTKEVGAVGVMRVVKEAYVDDTAFDPKAKYFDAKSDPGNPRWRMVDFQFVRRFDVVPIAHMKEHPAMQDSILVARKRQPSVMPLAAGEFAAILEMAD